MTHCNDCNSIIHYACTPCYLKAHNNSYEHPTIEDNFDILFTDWVCSVCLHTDISDREDTCTACDDSLTEHGTTVGGMCDMCETPQDGYWEYHTYMS